MPTRALVLALTVAACQSAAPPPPADMAEAPATFAPLASCARGPTQTSLVYSTRDPSNIFDFYPTCAANPIIVFVHGGGWKSGDKSAPGQQALFATLGDLGYNIVSVEYRLTEDTSGANSGHVWPQPINDVKCLLQHLAADGSFGDVRRLGVWGHSAGAHLALMAALTSPGDYDGGGDCGASGSYRVIGAVGSSSPIDLSQPSVGEQPDVERLLGVTTWDDSGPVHAAALAASPIAYVDAADPRLLLLSGAADPLIPPERNSGALAQALAALGRSDVWINYVAPTSHNSVYAPDAVGPNGEANADAQITAFFTP